MNLQKISLLALMLLVAGGARADATLPLYPAQPLVMQNFQGTLWVQTSVEHAALCRQAFAAAASHLDEALADPSWSAALEQHPHAENLPPAIIVDVDETVLDNSPFQAALLKSGRVFDPAMFNGWVESAQAKPLPGAVEFLQAAAKRGVRIFYITNRKASQEAATRDNLARVGFPMEQGVDTLLMRRERPEWIWDKRSRREVVTRRYRVLMLIGDDFNDFIGDSRTSLEKRREMSAAHREWWGQRWIILPNPGYGSWLGALYNYEWGMNDEEKRLMRQQALELYSP